MNRAQLDVQAAIPEREAPPLKVGEQLPRRVYIRRGMARYVHRHRYRVPSCEIGIEAGGSQRGMPCKDCQAHDRP